MKLAAVRFVLARALHQLGETAEALRLARNARESYRDAAEPAPELEAWLARHDR